LLADAAAARDTVLAAEEGGRSWGNIEVIGLFNPMRKSSIALCSIGVAAKSTRGGHRMLERIAVRADVHFGKPCIAASRSGTEDELKNAFVVAEPAGHRIRRLPRGRP